MANIIGAINELLKLPYYKNYASSSGAVHNISKHEDVISSTLEKYGFRKFIPVIKLKFEEAKKWMYCPNLSKDIPDGVFIEQPFGTQHSPDFIVKINDKFVIFLEAKSSETALFPTYNSGGVNPEYLYVFCSKRTNSTTIYKGESIITLAQQQLIDEHIEWLQQGRE